MLVSLKVTAGTRLSPVSGVLLTTAPEVPLSIIMDRVWEPVGLTDALGTGEVALGEATRGEATRGEGVRAGIPLLRGIEPSGFGWAATEENFGDIMFAIAPVVYPWAMLVGMLVSLCETTMQ